MIEDEVKSTIFGIFLGLVIIVGVFIDWSNDTLNSVFTINSNREPPVNGAALQNKSGAKKQELDPVKKQGVEPVKKLIIEPTLNPDSSNHPKSTKSPQTGDASRQEN